MLVTLENKIIMRRPAAIFKHLSMLWVLLVSACSTIAQKAPNFLVILMDDMGYDDLSFHGHKYLETSHIDKLATESVRFTDFTVCSVCAPTRAGLLTGRHFLRTGVDGVHGGREFLNLDEKVLPEYFKAAGYATGMFGKWHSGKTDGYFPWDRGFDQAYMANLYNYYPSLGWLNGVAVSENRWAEEVITDYALDFIRNNKDKPFFLYVPYMTPHGLWKAPELHVKKYLDKGLSLPFSTLCGMMDYIDLQIGRLLSRLDDLSLTENTIVVFLSDNGPQSSDRNLGELTAYEWNARNPSGYPGWKANNWANGVKSPLFLRYPGKWKPSDVSRLVDVTDLLPTFIELAGIDNPGFPKPLDGRSIKPYLEGKVNDLPEKTVYFSRWFTSLGESTPISQYKPIPDDLKKEIEFNEQSIGIRDEHFKLLLNYQTGPRPELKGHPYLFFNLQDDPLETTHVADDYPEVAASMIEKLEKWYSDVIFNEKSLQAPWFQIGWRGKDKSELLAYGPCAVYGNVVNNSHVIENWKAPGDRADYQIEVLTPAKYMVEMHLGKANSAGIIMKLTYGDQKIEKTLSGENIQTFEILNLQESKGILSLQIVNAPKGAYINQIREFRFIKIE